MPKKKAKKGLRQAQGKLTPKASQTGQKLQVRPLGDKVLVKTNKESDQTKTKSGIIIPDTIDKERPEEGIVVAVGAGKRLDNGQLVPLQVKKGDRIIFSKYGPDEIKINDEEFLIISESNILAIYG